MMIEKTANVTGVRGVSRERTRGGPKHVEGIRERQERKEDERKRPRHQPEVIYYTSDSGIHPPPPPPPPLCLHLLLHLLFLLHVCKIRFLISVFLLGIFSFFILFLGSFFFSRSNFITVSCRAVHALVICVLHLLHLIVLRGVTPCQAVCWPSKQEFNMYLFVY